MHYVDLWSLDRRQFGISPESAFLALSDSERDRAGDWHSHLALRRFVQSRWALRSILARYLGGGPRDIVLAPDRHGKPGVVGSDIEVSLSHSGFKTVVAVSLFGSIGVDIESDRPIPDCRALAQRVMSAREMAQFRCCDQRRSSRRLLELWTRKEAVLKCMGIGLLRDPGTLDLGWHCRSLKIDGEHFSICRCHLEDDVICALASTGSVLSYRHRVFVA